MRIDAAKPQSLGNGEQDEMPAKTKSDALVVCKGKNVHDRPDGMLLDYDGTDDLCKVMKKSAPVSGADKRGY